MLRTWVKIHEHPALRCSLQTFSVCKKWGSSTTILSALSRARDAGGEGDEAPCCTAELCQLRPTEAIAAGPAVPGLGPRRVCPP